MNLASFISSWLKDIISLFILISIVGLVMPKGNMKRYVDFVVGLLIIFTIVNPFIKLIKEDFSLDKEVMSHLDNQGIASNEDMIVKQEKQIEKLYKDKLSEEIKKAIEGEFSYRVYSIDLKIDVSDENYGEIKSATISLLSDEDDEKEREIKVEKIQPISIEDKNPKVVVSDDSYDDVKNLISKEFNIEFDKIYIYIKDKGV